MTGLTVLEAALIGTALGGATGLLTDESQLDLGEPIWKKWSGSSSAGPAAKQTGHAAVPRANASLVASTQAGLSKLGYDPGPVDGIPGPRTSAAIAQYQLDHDLSVDGKFTEQLSQHIWRLAAN